MSKSTRNSGKSWSGTDKAALKKLAGGNTPTRVIGLKLGRTAGAVQSQASKQGVRPEADEPGALRLKEEVVVVERSASSTT